ncbi:hypothetical protein KAR28_05705 [Candidatus Parcubacteria bacterium]|nr:hypothetical protein [Candidatus Parcubacteria bacterium]
MSPIKTKRQECEVYSRVCGYLRPINQWNDAKASEHNHRVKFKVNNGPCC